MLFIGKERKLKTVLLSGFGLVIILLVLTCGLAWYFLSGAKTIATGVEEDDVPGAFLYLDMGKNVSIMQTNVLEYLSGETEGIQEDFREAYKNFGIALDRVTRLEVGSIESLERLSTIRALVDEYFSEVNRSVFQSYDPLAEIWALKAVDDLEDNQGAELEVLLDQLTENDYREALESTTLEQAIGDDIPGLRYYLELLDQSGDMLSSLAEYVGGEIDEKDAYDDYADEFLIYFNLLTTLEIEEGDKENLDKIRKLFDDLEDTSDVIFKRYDPQTKKDAIATTDQLERTIYAEVDHLLTTAANEEQTDAKTALAKLVNSMDSTVAVLIGVTLFSLVLGFLIAFGVSNMIGSALIQVLRITESLSHNDITEARNLLKVDIDPTLKKLSDPDSKIAGGLSYFSEFEEVRNSLTKAVDDLERANISNAQQDWLKSGISELSKKLSGELPLTQMAKNTVDFICEYLGASVGFVYRTHTAEGEEHSQELHLMSHYGALVEHGEDGRGMVFYPGEGLVGQAMSQKKIIERNLELNERLPIAQSAASHTTPAYIVVAPLLYEDNVEGVIEIGHNQPMTRGQLEFIEQVIPSIGIAMRVSTSRDTMTNLLRQSQLQASQLEQQQGMLGESNEQLKQKAAELEDKQATLRNQNLSLQKVRQDLERQARELEQSSKYKSEFLANMSHELRSPLNSLLILANLLKENKEQNLTDKQIEYATVIHRSGSDLLSIINDVLDLSKIEAGKFDVIIENMNLDSFLTNLYQRYIEVANMQGLAFTTRNDSGLATIKTDPKRFQQVIINLLSNAFKFTEKGEVQLVIERINKGMKDSDGKEVHQDMLCVKVADSGIGIDSDKLNAVFNAFAQGDGNTNRKYGGTGLGLSISRQLIELLGGYITVTSKVGVGTTMYTYLPLELIGPELGHDSSSDIFTAQRDAPATTNTMEASNSLGLTELQKAHIPAEFALLDEEVSAAASEFESSSVDISDTDQLAERRLLIIESNPELHAQLKKQGEQTGFNVVTAFDGGKGLQFAEELLPTAIIMSEDAECVDGTLVLEKLKANIKTRHIPVYVLTEDYNKLRNPELVKMGAIGSSFKPIDDETAKQIMEAFSSRIKKAEAQVLIIAEKTAMTASLSEFLTAPGLKIDTCENTDSMIKMAQDTTYDCIVLNISQATDISFIQQVIDGLSDSLTTPLIIHSNEPLTKPLQAMVDQVAEQHPVSPVMSRSALLIETSLFLHQISRQLPEEQRRILFDQLNSNDVLNNKNLLVVDDQISNIFALTSVLEEHGIHCTIANNGKEGLSLLEGGDKVDLVLMDIMMPEMDGYETMQHIRNMSGFEHLPIIALTAKSMPEDREKCIRAGANDYLTKPLDPDKLLKLLNIWLVHSPNGVYGADTTKP
ncbi:response regulator [Vibrio atypicus]|uniref:response regulator n=1 Tax=Vibrio atypicus TaxID=558271 RepID=UPI003736874D